MLPAYELIADCLQGETKVKSRKTLYLPQPNATDKSNDNSERYRSYLARAVFYNVTQRTLGGLCGQVFSRDPVISVPTGLEAVQQDADGSGVDLVQLAKKASRYVIGYGRAGMLTDFPTTITKPTVEEIARGDIRPTILLYRPERIINWRTVKHGARELLSLVVLEEPYVISDDGFQAIEGVQYRVLRLVNNVYTVEVWQALLSGTCLFAGDDNSFSVNASNMAIARTVFKQISTSIPTDANGQPLTEIPFSFIGSDNNDSFIDQPPLYDIASLNIAHYRNSADYEESAYITGQPTPIFTGLTQDWVENVLKGRIELGARGSVPLPVGADAKLLQSAPNSMPFEAMEHKEKQMVALGARLVENRQVVRTASEANIDHASETSTLASVAKNVSTATTKALQWGARFTGDAEQDIEFRLNTDFDIASMTADDQQKIVQTWVQGAISWPELRTVLRKAGVATEDDEVARTQIDDEQLAMLQSRIKEKTAGAAKPGASSAGAK